MERVSAIQALEIKNVVFVGAGFVGGPTAAVLASRVKEVDVAVVDIDQAKIQAWNSGKLPIFEPGLDELVMLNRYHDCTTQNETSGTKLRSPLSADLPSSKNMSSDGEPLTSRKNLCFSTNVDRFIKQADLIFLCVDTPQRRDSHGNEGPPDLTSLKKAVDQIGKVAVKHFIVVEKSTVPSGTALLIRKTLRHLLSTDIQFEVLSNPEFLAEGSAVKNLEYPDRVLIGAADTADGFHASTKLIDLYKHWVPCSKIITSDIYSAELSKLCANALLAQRVSSINSLGIVCERMGGDIREITKIVQSDPRIGNHMLSASAGFGGSCFPKDVAHLVYLASILEMHEVAEYWSAVLKINTLRKESFADRICNAIKHHHIYIKDVAILGFAFKSGSNDARNSAAIDITTRLLSICSVRIYDPFVSESDIRAYLSLDGHFQSQTEADTLRVCPDARSACEGVSAVVILTDWDEFRYEVAPLQEIAQTRTGFLLEVPDTNPAFPCRLADRSQSSDRDRRLCWKQVAGAMQEPKLLFDGRNVVPDSIAELGFKIERIGKGEYQSETQVLDRLHQLEAKRTV